jgi:hypothetical protein
MPIFEIQFHPEITHTPRGVKLLENFIVGICGAVALDHGQIRGQGDGKNLSPGWG